MCVPVVVGRGGSVDEIVNRSDFGGVLLFIGLQRYSKRVLIPGVPAEAVYLVVSMVECRVEVPGVQVVILVPTCRVPCSNPELRSDCCV